MGKEIGDVLMKCPKCGKTIMYDAKPTECPECSGRMDGNQDKRVLPGGASCAI